MCKCVMCKVDTDNVLTKGSYKIEMCKKCTEVMRDMFKRKDLGEFFGDAK